jgi:hypothetical protein
LLYALAPGSRVVAVGFAVGLTFGVVFGVFIGTVGFPATMGWFARREYREASERADDGPFPRIEVGSADRVRSPEHAN